MRNDLQKTLVQVSLGNFCGLKEKDELCGTEIMNIYSLCGGNLGAPVFSFDQTLSAIVVEDKFCGDQASGVFLAVFGYKEWVEEITSRATLGEQISYIFFGFSVVVLSLQTFLNF